MGSKDENGLSGAYDLGKCDIEDLLFKVLVVGDFGVGKTSLIRRYTEGMFHQSYKITIGVDFSVKELVWNNKKHITLQLWDIAGHERFGHMTRVYYKYATAAIIVYDLTRPATLHSVLKWQRDLWDKVEHQNGFPIPVILIANKCDLGCVDPRTLSAFCQEHGFAGWLFTSAKENININEAMNFLIERILLLREEDRMMGMRPSDPSIRSLTLPPKNPQKKKSLCCR
ncbi:ras-related protein Rab-32B-like [Ornithodoros turicata]|uniref:ras-related protein Rab-32B-like n=1 Tax=Ornithodoros turicata TaxID=34597 RepID=UPI003138D50B